MAEAPFAAGLIRGPHAGHGVAAAVAQLGEHQAEDLKVLLALSGSPALSGSLWLSLAPSGSLWLSLALSGSLRLSLALPGSRGLSLALSGFLCLALARSGSL